MIQPFGGKLVNLLAPSEETAELTAYANALPSLRLSARTLCDLELLATGAFSPLDGFMNQRDYRRVLDEMRLTDNHLFPIPVTLGVDESAIPEIGQTVALRDAGNNLQAVLDVEEVYEWNREELALKVFGTPDYGGSVNLGQRGGEEFHTLTNQEMPTHTHSVAASNSAPTPTTPIGNFWAQAPSGYSTTANGAMSPNAVGSNGGGQGHENRSPFLTLKICIALIGIFPTRN
ncbi:MAG: hypothetical protein M3367_01335 [Acidobacteriota bacterium]|nr:hypothetical protein [Acidobacteriota bacterium]